MKRVTASVIAALLGGTAAILAQEPRAENFDRLRTLRIDGFERTMTRLETKGFDRAAFDDGRRLDGNVSSALGIASDVRVLKLAEIRFPGGRDLTFIASTNTTDIVLSEKKVLPDGQSSMMVFYTDPTLALKGAASGTATDTLQAIPIDADTAAAFRGVLMAWDRALPNMLDSPFGRK